jgi:hypothetical protein
MKALIAVLIFGIIATSASAAGTDMHTLRPEFSSQQQHSTPRRTPERIDISVMALRALVAINGRS